MESYQTAVVLVILGVAAYAVVRMVRRARQDSRPPSRHSAGRNRTGTHEH